MQGVHVAVCLCARKTVGCVRTCVLLSLMDIRFRYEQQAMEAKDAFGLERAYGVVCLTMGGFRSRRAYLDFYDSQTTADIAFDAAIEYSDLLREMYHLYVKNEDELAKTIKTTRAEIGNLKAVDSDDQVGACVCRRTTVFNRALLLYRMSTFIRGRCTMTYTSM